MTSTGVYIKQLGDMYRSSFSQHLKYNLHEAGTFRDLFTQRDQSYQSFIRAERALQDKKERLFKLKDTTKWGGFKDDVQQVRFKPELVNNKEAAFDFMLPQETTDVEGKKMELCFFTNQCWDEIRRVSNDNGGLLFEHFKDMAQLHCSQIQNVSHIFLLLV